MNREDEQQVLNLILQDSLENCNHIYFIVGRGRNPTQGGMNIPLNSQMKNCHCIFIDAIEKSADIVQQIEEIDFSTLGISKGQKYEKIELRFYFDWSSFYCGAVQDFTAIAQRLNRPFSIWVPLSKGESKVPSDVKRHLDSPIFTLTTAEGKYPLFDWERLEGNPDYQNLVNDKNYMICFAFL